MRILFAVHQFFPNFSGGTEKITLSLALAMQRAGHYVEILTYGPGLGRYRSGHGLFVHTYAHEGIAVTSLEQRQIPWDLSWSLEPLAEQLGCIRKILKRKKFDLIHITHFMKIPSVAEAALREKVPYVLTLTDYFSICHRFNLLTANGVSCFGPNKGNTCSQACAEPGMSLPYFVKRLKTSKRLLAQSKAVVTPSAFLASRIQREFPGIKIRVVAHGTSSLPLGTHEKKYSAASPVVFGYSGSIHPLKGVHALVRAFKQIPLKNCRLKICGGLSQAPTYAAELISASRDDARITFCWPYSSAEGLASFLESIDVLCVPSEWFETYGMVVEEAFSARIPVIASSAGALPERVRDGAQGFIFRAGQADDLHRKLLRIAKRPQILNRLKTNILSHTTVEEEALQYEAIYQTLAV